jgi:hypothetical protein
MVVNIRLTEVQIAMKRVCRQGNLLEQRDGDLISRFIAEISVHYLSIGAAHISVFALICSEVSILLATELVNLVTPYRIVIETVCFLNCSCFSQ